MKCIIVGMIASLLFAMPVMAQQSEQKVTCEQKLAVTTTQFSQEKNLSIEREAQMLSQHMALQDDLAKVKSELETLKKERTTKTDERMN